jgi:hypothetical protein
VLANDFVVSIHHKDSVDPMACALRVVTGTIGAQDRNRHNSCRIDGKVRFVLGSIDLKVCQRQR